MRRKKRSDEHPAYPNFKRADSAQVTGVLFFVIKYKIIAEIQVRITMIDQETGVKLAICINLGTISVLACKTTAINRLPRVLLNKIE